MRHGLGLLGASSCCWPALEALYPAVAPYRGGLAGVGVVVGDVGLRVGSGALGSRFGGGANVEGSRSEEMGRATWLLGGESWSRLNTPFCVLVSFLLRLDHHVRDWNDAYDLRLERRPLRLRVPATFDHVFEAAHGSGRATALCGC